MLLYMGLGNTWNSSTFILRKDTNVSELALLFSSHRMSWSASGRCATGTLMSSLCATAWSVPVLSVTWPTNGFLRSVSTVLACPWSWLEPNWTWEKTCRCWSTWHRTSSGQWAQRRAGDCPRSLGRWVLQSAQPWLRRTWRTLLIQQSWPASSRQTVTVSSSRVSLWGGRLPIRSRPSQKHGGERLTVWWESRAVKSNEFQSAVHLCLLLVLPADCGGRWVKVITAQDNTTRLSSKMSVFYTFTP